jgi:hypothetical protein
MPPGGNAISSGVPQSVEGSASQYLDVWAGTGQRNGPDNASQHTQCSSGLSSAICDAAPAVSRTTIRSGTVSNTWNATSATERVIAHNKLQTVLMYLGQSANGNTLETAKWEVAEGIERRA